ncbi:WRKY DNA-binding transcription factor 70-like [Lycium ferocissimum]|uniref:WRKY DNA-binding transcription factor 70-like n=1 Tax=Lycium ferocissimum TaxID=112874 RepID=UPI00281652C1|nr:WRKY DNA-binding transcription factor 70-like [Lycium ferocissimum]
MVAERPRTNRKRLIKQHLVQGKEFAVQLQTLLQQPLAHHKPVLAHDLILKILTSFTEALSELNFAGSKGVFQIPKADSDFRKKDKQVVKDRRVCNRRRRNASDSCTRESTTTEDGHAWRKYGQKVILNSKYPRCYYRCSHKYDKECPATKQVQRIKEDPIIYRTTYFDRHVCKCSLKKPLHQVIISGEDSKLHSDISSALDGQDLMPSSPAIMADDFSLEGVVSIMTSSDLHGLDMDDISKFGDFHFEALEFS